MPSVRRKMHTDGEIYAVIARRSDDYFATAAFAVSLAAILGGFVVALVLHQYWIAIDARTFMTAFAFAYLAALAVLVFAPSLALRLVPRNALAQARTPKCRFTVYRPQHSYHQGPHRRSAVRFGR
jgi:uncharacterized membrane protein